MRVLVTGMGGELGSRVAQLLEERREVEDIVGVDFIPPRRRLTRSKFRRIDPRQRAALAQWVTDARPTAICHLGVYEPYARSAPHSAAERTAIGTVAVLGAAGRLGTVERVVVRSGIEVYSRGRRSPTVPDEDVLPAPGSPYGRTCLEVEALATGLARRAGIPVATLRLAPVVAPHIPSPLARLLRMPVVPVSALNDPPFQVVHAEDAARAIVAALLTSYDGPLNIVGSGAASVWQAVRLGGRVPIPVTGIGWEAAKRLALVAGAPLPNHVEELFRRGRCADGSRAGEVLALGPMRHAQEILTEVFEWASVTPLRTVTAVAS
jgi:UDP-glucose 4-epimerase